MKKNNIVLLFTLCVTLKGFGLIPDAYAFDADQIQIHGFISQGYLISSDHDFWFAATEDGTFQFNEMGINFIAEPLDNLRLGIQMLSRDMGKVGNNKVEVDWAYGDYRFRNWLGIRAGLMKRPFGLYNQFRDIDAARTGVFLPMGVYPDITRDFYLATQGVGVYGMLPGGLSYEVQYGTVPLDTDDGIVKIIENDLGFQTENIDNDDVFAFMLRWNTPLSGLALAFTGLSMGDVVAETNLGRLNVTRFEVYVPSLEYEFGDFSFSAEYRYQTTEMNLNDTIMLMDEILEAWHTTAAYRLTDWFELGLGYSVVYDNRDDKDGDRFKERGLPGSRAWRKDLALSTRFDISDYWIFKLEGHYINGLRNVTSDLSGDPSEDWFLFAAKMTFTF